jgi:hypothetical protein
VKKVLHDVDGGIGVAGFKAEAEVITVYWP